MIKLRKKIMKKNHEKKAQKKPNEIVKTHE
jgi:hypothetical protein